MAAMDTGATSPAMRYPRARWLAVLAVAIVTVIVVYRHTFLSMADKWNDDTAFSYGFLIAPIALWLAWRRREWLRHVEFTPSWLGAAAAIGAAMLWLVAKGTGVLVVEQLAAVLTVQALVLALLGWRAVRALLFPLAFLLFLVPFGRALVPWLVDITADIATVLLRLSGVPVYRTHTLINIPGGWFQVARACSGVSFLMTALVLGLLYAELNFSSWRKRVVAVLLACAIPVVANALRVYITIGVSHLTDMKFGPGAEHVTFGQFFFIAIMLATFWVGRRWHDEEPGLPAWLRDAAPATRRPTLVEHLPFACGMAVVLAAPFYQAAYARQLQASGAAGTELVAVPSAAVAGWTRMESAPDAWRPLYRGGLVEQQGSYVDAAGERVDVFVAVYGLGTSGGAEMIGYDNVLYAEEKEVVAAATVRRIELAGETLTVREVLVPDRGGRGRLVWQWFVVGDRTSTNPYAVKALEALAWITHEATHERVITLATRPGLNARATLEAFATAHARCVAASFATEACGP
jgi:exosortase A